MFPSPAGITDSDWEATPPAVRALLEQRINHVAQLEEQKGRSSRNSSKPPSSDGSGFQPPARQKGKGSGRKRGGQEGHPGASCNLLPTEQCAEVIPPYPQHLQ